VQITRTFQIAYPLDTVWRAMSDVHLVASCLPGAAVTEELGDDRYKGSFHIKVGPLAAAFAGEVSIARQPGLHIATVTGKGTDPRSTSRASGTMTYRLLATGDATTQVEVESTLNLAGALAQFGKAGVVQEIASRITATFVQNLQARLAEVQATTAEPARGGIADPAASDPGASMAVASVRAGDTPASDRPAKPAAAPQPMDAGGMLWSVLRDGFIAWLRRLFGRRAASDPPQKWGNQ
jgi:carbon monoxide dehydrogenase subunit G